MTMTFTRKHIVTVGILWLATLAMMGGLILHTSRVTDAQRADLIQRGAYASWDVNDGCLDSSEACDEALARQNAELARYGLEIMEDGSTVPADLAEHNRQVERGNR